MANKKVKNIVVEYPETPGEFGVESGIEFGPFSSPEERDAEPTPESFNVELDDNMELVEVSEVVSVNVRSKPNTSSAVNYVAKRGTKFRSVKVSKEWSRVIGVDAGSHPKGYIMSKFLKIIKK